MSLTVGSLGTSLNISELGDYLGDLSSIRIMLIPVDDLIKFVFFLLSSLSSLRLVIATLLQSDVLVLPAVISRFVAQILVLDLVVGIDLFARLEIVHVVFACVRLGSYFCVSKDKLIGNSRLALKINSNWAVGLLLF